MVIALIYYGQLHQMTTQNATIRDNFLLEQRAWVGVPSFRCDCKLDVNNNLIIGELWVTLTNTGKTPALRMDVRTPYVNRKYSEPIPKYEDTLKDTQDVWNSFGGFAKDTSPEIIKRFETPPAFVLAPNASREFLVVKGYRVLRPFTRNINDEIVTYVIGRVTYHDAMTQDEHMTTFCMSSNMMAEFFWCTSGNNMN